MIKPPEKWPNPEAPSKDSKPNPSKKKEEIDHPDHYGGDTVYEVIKVIEAWKLNFNLGSLLKYVGRPTKGEYLKDLKKGRWYLDREIRTMELEELKHERED